MSNGITWVTIIESDGDITGLVNNIETAKTNINKINRNLDRKLDKQEVDSAGLFLANGEGKVFMRYDNDGFDVEKANQHFKDLVEPDLSDYAKKEDIPEQKTIIGDTEQDGIFFSDDKGNVFFKYDNENGIDAEKVSEHLKGLINPSDGSGSSNVMKEVEEGGAFFVGTDSKVFAKYDDTNGFDVNKMSDHMKGLINKGGVPHITKINQTLSENNPIHLDTPDCKYNQTISFSGFIDNTIGMGELVINRGDGENIAGNTSITIDSTNITVKSVTNDVTHNIPIPHGLTIKDFIIVNIKVGLFDAFNYLGSTITIITNDNTKPNGFKRDIIFRGSKLGVDAKVYGTGVTLTNCSLSWSCSDLLKSLWCFGDSYFDYWPTRAARMGYGNAMYDGYSGRKTADGMKSLKKCLELAKPKTIFWCMGANDPDVISTANNNPWDGESGAVNASWNANYEELKTICNKHGIELILYTVHNGINKGGGYVLRISLWKNELIRNSGYRYVDVYNICKDPNKQINRIEDGHYVTDFFDNMNDSSDWVHPNIFGANIIAHYIAANLPELKDEVNFVIKDNISSLDNRVSNLENNN